MAGPDYYARFGEFIHWYAIVERIVHYVFRHFSGLPEEVARTIDGGTALSSLVSLIRRVVKARNVSEVEQIELEALFDHLNHIMQLRDSLIHRGGENIGELVLSTNVHVARTRLDIEILELNLDDIKAAAHDCIQLFSRFERLMWPDDERMKGAQEWLGAPWRYKPRQPRKPNQPPSRSARPRPPASRG